MNIGIVGLPQSGKTTVFNALTGAGIDIHTFSGSQEPNIAVVKVPDPRLDFLHEKFGGSKKRQIEIKYTDFAPVQKSSAGGKGFPDKHIAELRACDALLLVVRAFEDTSMEQPTPEADLESLLLEFALADLQVVENRIQRIEEGEKKGSKEDRALLEHEKPIMQEYKKLLEEGKFAASLEISKDDEKITRSYGLLTLKPIIIVISIGEGQIGKIDLGKFRPLLPFPAPLMELAGRLEMDIAQLDPAEREEFMSDFGLTDPASDRVIRETFSVLGLICFYTGAGGKETVAWPVTKGDNALAAAARIHSDIARGFIRAEVVSYEDYVKFGDMAKIREAGKFRLEGKEYIVNDGDIMLFRFNV